MGKQAIGLPTTNYNARLDTMLHVLIYGQKAPCATRTMKYTLMDQIPSGTTAILAYTTYSGYGQEDAKIMNKCSVQRGFFNTLYFRSYVDTYRAASAPINQVNIAKYLSGKLSGENGITSLAFRKAVSDGLGTIENALGDHYG